MEEKWNKLLRILSRKWMKAWTMDSKLNMEGCTFRRKLTYRQRRRGTGFRGFYEIKQLRDRVRRVEGFSVFTEEDICT